MKFGSFNVKDNFINNHGGQRDDGKSNADIVSKIIIAEEFDLLGTQELTINYVNEIATRLKDYKFYGDYRYGNIIKKMPFNETNSIITNKKIDFTETIHLPWIPNNITDLKTSIVKFSIMPRIATIVIINDEENGRICMINTHLDYQVPSIQLRQLQELKKLIQKYSQNYPVILTGDFNMELEDYNFNNFRKDIRKENKLVRVDINDKTWHNPKGEDKVLDHIFIPDYWTIENAGIISSQETSDHDLIYVNTKVKRK